MNNLYQTKPIQDGFGTCLRPGGLTLTKRLLENLNIKQYDTVMDAGCGVGTSLKLLQDYTDNVFGLEFDSEFAQIAVQSGYKVIQGDFNNLPIADNSLDFLISECAWNLTDRKKSVREIYRVLKPGGKVGIIDIFLQEQNKNDVDHIWPVRSCLNSASSMNATKELFTHNNFQNILFEDHSQILKQAAAEFVFAHGSLQNFWQAVTGSQTKAQQACNCGKENKPGLFMLTAQKLSTKRNVT